MYATLNGGADVSGVADGTFISGNLYQFYSLGGVFLELTGDLKMCGDETLALVDNNPVVKNLYQSMTTA